MEIKLITSKLQQPVVSTYFKLTKNVICFRGQARAGKAQSRRSIFRDRALDFSFYTTNVIAEEVSYSPYLISLSGPYTVRYCHVYLWKTTVRWSTTALAGHGCIVTRKKIDRMRTLRLSLFLLHDANFETLHVLCHIPYDARTYVYIYIRHMHGRLLLDPAGSRWDRRWGTEAHRGEGRSQ